MIFDDFFKLHGDVLKAYLELVAKNLEVLKPVSLMVAIERESGDLIVSSYPPSKALVKGMIAEMYNVFCNEDSAIVENSSNNADEGEEDEEEGEEEGEEESEEEQVAGVEKGSAERWLRKRARYN